jgi:DNA-binding NtrC family response regulator
LSSVARKENLQMDQVRVWAADPIQVLIVDDNLAYAQNIAEILELMGCVTELFENAEAALKAVALEACLVITDYRLPGMNGVDLVRRILLERPQVHAVVISAYADDEVVAATRALGAEFLPKPVDFAVLNRIVARRTASA